MSVPTGPGEPVGDPLASPAGDRQAAFAATLVDEWVRAGVTHAVVCPGSRSTPLAVALADRPEVRVHVRLDERSAAFTALGIGLAGAGPALVVTTSGTAAAELHPAVVESDLSGVPLIACTADRPPELRDVGAPQTIDQTRIFGGCTRWFADPGVPDEGNRQAWRSLASRAVAEALGGPGGPGPVHLNLPFREPLLGDPSSVPGTPRGRPDGRPWHQVPDRPPTPPTTWLEGSVSDGMLAPGRRGLLVAGAGCGDGGAVLALGDALGWPVLAEPRSGLRIPHPSVVATADAILRAPGFAGRHRPEVVLRLGEPWVSKVVNSFLADAAGRGAPDIVVTGAGRWTDPERGATAVLRADPTGCCLQLADLVGRRADHREDGREWLASWTRAEARARSVIDRQLAPAPDRPSRPITEPALAHRLMARVDGAATVVVSSSMPVRDVESFSLPRQRPPRVLSNRGANGIDGVVSTALGVALASKGPTVALVGDLAFLHDVSSLVGSEALEVDLTVVVADNGGGGIFSFLPPARALAPTTFEQLFGTPQSPDVADVARGFGWPVTDLGPEAPAGALEEALDLRVGSGVPSVIRVRLPSRPDNVAEHDRIYREVVSAVDGD